MIRTERKDAVLTVILARPAARNAVDREHADGLANAFRAFEKDDSLSVAVLWGEGGTFCAGADLKAVAAGDADRANRLDADGDAPMGPSRMRLTKPVIAAIEGHAVAGGLELAAWCDLRVAAEGATLGVFCRRWGVPLIDGGTVRLPRIVGMGRALDLILTGRPVSAREAHGMGLVDRVAPDGHAREEAEKLAAEIARFPQACMRADRASVYEQWDLSLDDAMRREFARGASVIAEGIEGAKRFTGGAGRGGSFE